MAFAGGYTGVIYGCTGYAWLIERFEGENPLEISAFVCASFFTERTFAGYLALSTSKFGMASTLTVSDCSNSSWLYSPFESRLFVIRCLPSKPVELFMT